MFFTVLGVTFVVIIALYLIFQGFMGIFITSAFSGKFEYFAIIPIIIGFAMLYAIWYFNPFEITIGISAVNKS